MNQKNIYQGLIERERSADTGNLDIEVGDVACDLLQVAFDFVSVARLDGGGEDGDGQGSEDKESRVEFNHAANVYWRSGKRCDCSCSSLRWLLYSLK